MVENIDYSKLRLDVLEKMVYSRGIECKSKKEEIIKMLKLDDEGKYVAPLNSTTYEKADGGFNVGVDFRNQSHLNQLGKMVERKEAKSLNRYSDNKIWYFSKIKLL